MGDRPMTTEQVASALTVLSSELAYPATPSMRNAVTARLENERAAGARPRSPPRALEPAAGARARDDRAAGRARARRGRSVRDRRDRDPRPARRHALGLPPPVTPDALGDPVPAEEAFALAGFEPSLPSGPPPTRPTSSTARSATRGSSSRGDRAPPIRPSGDRLGAGADRVPGRRRDDHQERAGVRGCARRQGGRRPRCVDPRAPRARELETERGFQTFSVAIGVVALGVPGSITYCSVETVAPSHPIMRGVPKKWETIPEELYSSRRCGRP